MEKQELTAKEKKRLKMKALGETAAEIAVTEYRSVNTINECFKKIKMKLQAKSDANAVYIGVKENIID